MSNEPKKPCNCVETVEENTLKYLKEKNSRGFIYDEDLNHFDGLGLSPVSYNFDSGQTMVHFPFSVMYSFKKVNGELSKPKKHTVNLYPTYCPFCGVKLREDEDKG